MIPCAFPSQILSGTYPIAQVREPYSVVGYLAVRVPLVRLLRLEHPEGMVTQYKRTAGRRLGDCDLKCDDLDPNLARLNLKDGHHETMLRKIEEERDWTPWNICDGESHHIVANFLCTPIPASSQGQSPRLQWVCLS